MPGNAHAVLAWLAARAIPGIEVVDASSYTRTLRGYPAPLRAEVRGNTVVGDAALVRVFHLDANAAEADRVLLAAADTHSVPLLAEQIRSRPRLAPPGCADAHEMAYRAILGQQVTVAAATLQLTRLAALSEPLPGNHAWRWFPSDAVIAERAHEVLRGPKARIATVQRIAAALADGTLDLHAEAEARTAALLEFVGIGPWTAGYISLRLGAPDILLTGDAAVRNGARALGIDDLASFGAQCEGWRSFVTLRCWAAAAASK